MAALMTYEQVVDIFKNMSTYEQVALSILYTKRLYKKLDWVVWANDWLSNKDRCLNTARVIYEDSNTMWHAARVGSAREAALWSSACAAHAASLVSIDITEGGERISTGYAKKSIILCGGLINPALITEVLTTHFICPHCYNLPNQHTQAGKCLFGAHTWEGINNVWKS